MAIQAALHCNSPSEGDADYDNDDSDSEDDLKDPNEDYDDGQGAGGGDAESYDNHLNPYHGHSTSSSQLTLFVLVVQRIAEALPIEGAVAEMVERAVGPEIQNLGALALVNIVAAQVSGEPTSE